MPCVTRTHPSMHDARGGLGLDLKNRDLTFLRAVSPSTQISKPRLLLRHQLVLQQVSTLVVLPSLCFLQTPHWLSLRFSSITFRLDFEFIVHRDDYCLEGFRQYAAPACLRSRTPQLCDRATSTSCHVFVYSQTSIVDTFVAILILGVSPS